MTARNGSAELHGNVQDGAGTVIVGNGVFQGAYSEVQKSGVRIRRPASSTGLSNPQGKESR